MYPRAIWKYFIDINTFNGIFSLIVGYAYGTLWGVVMFSSFGILIGFFGFFVFKKNEYYTYYNLGLTKTYLIKKVWLLNLCISIPLFLIYLIIIK